MGGWVGAAGRSCSSALGAGTSEPAGKSLAVAESVVVMEGHVVATWIPKAFVIAPQNKYRQCRAGKIGFGVARHSVRGGGGNLIEIPPGGNHGVLANSCIVVGEDVLKC